MRHWSETGPMRISLFPSQLAAAYLHYVLDNGDAHGGLPSDEHPPPTQPVDHLGGRGAGLYLYFILLGSLSTPDHRCR